MPLTTTELHDKAQLCMNRLAEELNIDPVEVPEPNLGYIAIPPDPSIKYEGYKVYFHGFPESSWAHRYVITKKLGEPLAQVHIQDDPILAAKTTALILRDLKERK